MTRKRGWMVHGRTRSTRVRPGLALALCALVLGIAPATSSAVTIDFEDRSQGQTVNSQYSGSGVTFNGPLTFNGSDPVAHSGTKWVENCYAQEFCSVPLRADFTAGQASVGTWVGWRGPLSNPYAVRLTALDGSGNAIGTADATISPNANSTPIATHLTVTVPGPMIRSLTVGPATPGDSSNNLAIDDVEFSTVGPPPPCGAAGPPSIIFSQAFQDATLQNNQLLISGSVNGRGAPITDATVISSGTTLRTARAFPSPIGGDGGNFAINMNGLLQEGKQTITLTATNCAGTTTSAPRTVTYAPLPAGTQFRQLGPIEVNQAVQDYNNTVPLIAGSSNGTKRTVARVYLGAEGGAAKITGVSGRLTATRPDGSRPGGPLAVTSLNAIDVPAGQTLTGARSTLGGSLNFELPAEWLTEGRLHLQLDRLEIEGAQTSFPCIACENSFAGPSTVNFHRVPPIRLWLVSVPYRPAPGATPNLPTRVDLDLLASWLRRVYPSAEVQITEATMPVQSKLPGDCNDLNGDIADWASTMSGQPPQTRYYGLVSDAGGFMRGCSNIGGQFGSGPAGCCRKSWDTDGAYTDWYGGHEIGHLFDRKHPDGGCEDSDDDSGYPFPSGAIGSSVFDNQGLDPGDATLGLPLQLFDWRDSWTDVMTYCDREWISSYTYRGILRNLCGHDKPNCPDDGQLVGRPAERRTEVGLSVNGSIDLSKNRVKLAPMSALKGLTPTARPKRGKYAIVLRAAGGKEIAGYPFKPSEVSDQPRKSRLAAINEIVPFSTKARQIQIVKGKRRIYSRRVSAHAPTVLLRSIKGRRLAKPVTISWRAKDADGGRPTATLQYAADGKHYVTIAAGLRKRSLRVDPDELPGGRRARFRVVVTDGVLTGTDASRRVKVEPKPPRVSIPTPRDGARYEKGETVQLTASVADPQRANPTRDAVVWRSSIQGELGSGAMLSTALQPGTHAITATATNPEGKSATATITVEVDAVPGSMNAVLVP